MVDLGGYVIILVETKDKKIKLYGKSSFSHVRSGVCANVEGSANISRKSDLNVSLFIL